MKDGHKRMADEHKNKHKTYEHISKHMTDEHINKHDPSTAHKCFRNMQSWAQYVC